MPNSPAFSYDAGCVHVNHIGNSACLGMGKSDTFRELPLPPRTGIFWPDHSLRMISIPSVHSSRLFSNESGAKTKSLGCQPEAIDSPTLPSDKLSTTDHSSATRIGLCSGSTTLPARSWML